MLAASPAVAADRKPGSDAMRWSEVYQKENEVQEKYKKPAKYEDEDEEEEEEEVEEEEEEEYSNEEGEEDYPEEGRVKEAAGSDGFSFGTVQSSSSSSTPSPSNGGGITFKVSTADDSERVLLNGTQGTQEASYSRGSKSGDHATRQGRGQEGGRGKALPESRHPAQAKGQVRPVDTASSIESASGARSVNRSSNGRGSSRMKGSAAAEEVVTQMQSMVIGDKKEEMPGGRAPRTERRRPSTLEQDPEDYESTPQKHGGAPLASSRGSKGRASRSPSIESTESFRSLGHVKAVQSGTSLRPKGEGVRKGTQTKKSAGERGTPEKDSYSRGGSDVDDSELSEASARRESQGSKARRGGQAVAVGNPQMEKGSRLGRRRGETEESLEFACATSKEGLVREYSERSSRSGAKEEVSSEEDWEVRESPASRRSVKKGKKGLPSPKWRAAMEEEEFGDGEVEEEGTRPRSGTRKSKTVRRGKGGVHEDAGATSPASASKLSATLPARGRALRHAPMSEDDIEERRRAGGRRYEAEQIEEDEEPVHPRRPETSSASKSGASGGRLSGRSKAKASGVGTPDGGKEFSRITERQSSLRSSTGSMKKRTGEPAKAATKTRSSSRQLFSPSEELKDVEEGGDKGQAKASGSAKKAARPAVLQVNDVVGGAHSSKAARAAMGARHEQGSGTPTANKTTSSARRPEQRPVTPEAAAERAAFLRTASNPAHVLSPKAKPVSPAPAKSPAKQGEAGGARKATAAATPAGSKSPTGSFTSPLRSPAHSTKSFSSAPRSPGPSGTAAAGGKDGRAAVSPLQRRSGADSIAVEGKSRSLSPFSMRGQRSPGPAGTGSGRGMEDGQRSPARFMEFIKALTSPKPAAMGEGGLVATSVPDLRLDESQKSGRGGRSSGTTTVRYSLKEDAAEAAWPPMRPRQAEKKPGKEGGKEQQLKPKQRSMTPTPGRVSGASTPSAAPASPRSVTPGRGLDTTRALQSARSFTNSIKRTVLGGGEGEEEFSFMSRATTPTRGENKGLLSPFRQRSFKLGGMSGRDLDEAASVGSRSPLRHFQRGSRSPSINSLSVDPNNNPGGTSPLRFRDPSTSSRLSQTQRPPPRPRRAVNGDATAGFLRQGLCEIREYYTVGAKIGEGRTGVVVYSVVEKDTGMAFACKSIAKTTLSDEKKIDALRREVQVMEMLKEHPTVVTLKEALEDEKDVHLVMEICEGGDLLTFINSAPHISERQAATICRTLARAVRFCHQQGVVHRDLKPENILMGSRGSWWDLRLADFGICAFVKPGEMLKGYAGSAFYISPEVLRGTYSQPVDTWSLGVILYVLLSQKLPFWSESDAGVYRQILRAEYDLASGPWTSISAGAKDLVEKMLTLDPTTRISLDDVIEHPWISANASEELAFSSADSMRSRRRGGGIARSSANIISAFRLPFCLTPQMDGDEMSTCFGHQMD